MLLWSGPEICVPLSPWPAVKNQVTDSFILNPKGKEATSRTFTAMGLEWEYAVEDAKESLKTSGPLPEAIAVLVSPQPAPWLLLVPLMPSLVTLAHRLCCQASISLMEILLFHCLQKPGQGQGVLVPG